MSEVYATQLRTAWRFKDVWHQWLDQIKTTTDFYGNLVVVARDCPTPDFWDHLPIAKTLSDAWYGTPHEPIEAQVAITLKRMISERESQILVYHISDQPNPPPKFKSGPPGSSFSVFTLMI